MIKIQVLKKIEYKKIPIYIRRLDTLFEYLVLFNNQLYSNYIIAEPGLLKQFSKEKYSEKQLTSIVGMLIHGAHTTIDELLKKKKAGKIKKHGRKKTS